MGDFRKNILQTDFERKEILQGNARHTMALYIREKQLYHQRFGEKNKSQTKSPIPPTPQKSNGRPLMGSCIK